MQLACVLKATNDKFLTVLTQLHLDNFALVMVVDFLVTRLTPANDQVDGASLRDFVVNHEVNCLGKACDEVDIRHKLVLVCFKYDLFAIFTVLA